MDYSRLAQLLEEDARASETELATMLGVNEAEVTQGIKKLKKDGVIGGYRAVINWRKLKSENAVAVIQVKVVPARKTGFDKVCTDIAKDKRVSDVFITSGKYDLMITVRADQIDDVSEFVTEKLAPMKEVVGTYTHVILKEFKRNGALFDKKKHRRLLVS